MPKLKATFNFEINDQTAPSNPEDAFHFDCQMNWHNMSPESAHAMEAKLCDALLSMGESTPA